MFCMKRLDLDALAISIAVGAMWSHKRDTVAPEHVRMIHPEITKGSTETMLARILYRL